MNELVKEKWDKILSFIRSEYGLSDVSYKTWILALSVRDEDEKHVTIMADDEKVGNSSLGLSHISKQYGKIIKTAIAEITGKEYEIEFVLKCKSNETESLKPSQANTSLNPRYTFDTFVTGDNNILAHAAAVAVSESPSEVYNPLFIYGGVGLGKTHLMQSIAHYIIDHNPNMKVQYTTSEKFTNELIKSIRNNTTEEFRSTYRNVDVLLIDDVQFIINKERTQEEFFNTFNSLREANKQIIISSDRPPKEMKTLEERLRSRFESGLIVDISSPDYETRLAILNKKAEDNALIIDSEILEYIAENVTSNVRTLEGSLNKVIALSRLKKKDITMDLAKEAIHDIVDFDTKHVITLPLIIDAVADYYNLTSQELYSKNRSGKIAYSRQIAMYLCRKNLNMSYTEIGREIGNRDRTTVMHGCSKIEEDLKNDTSVQQIIDEINKKISDN